MKFFITLFCIFFTSICSADAYHHEFEGISEFYNIRNLRALAKFLPANPVIIEAGSYQGSDTIKLAQRFPEGRIFSFEPLTTAFPILSKAVEPYPNVTLQNVAIDENSGKKNFYICHGTNGESPIFEFHSSLLKPTGGAAIHLMGPIELVSCISLHDFCKKNRIKKIDMLWLSTEGNELQVLKGAKKLLDKTTLVYARSQLFYSREAMTLFEDLKCFMESSGFILLSHFYLKNFHGDALFIKKEKFND